MRLFSFVLVLVVIAAFGGGAYYYMMVYQPMVTEYERMKTGMPELDNARNELRKYRDKERLESSWVKPAVDTLSAGLSDEVTAGKAEVLSGGDKVIINISEQVLFQPGSKTFAPGSAQFLLKLESLLRSEKIAGKDLSIGNATKSPAAQPKSKGRVLTKDPRTLAMERSLELVKYLEKKGINPDTLITVAYASKQPLVGQKIKDQKTMIIIANQPQISIAVAKEPVPQTKVTPTTKLSTTAVTTVSSVATATTKTVPMQPKQASQTPKK
ncbi:MAG: hypothetical protein WC539_06345 [Nitrospirota bacterium]